ncbi:murein biosynthesis integral membrane protein MurJ [Pseudonocardia sp. N23]|uniref:murein biosynthesis integral membrane protein MurJ n=1 Tax=Pseudonocardia sp. N23 TaxID=1987376 RepID=UPI000BFCDCF3|nr:murein biosynthesis integral membrane protein MurJ [Pseudonocardia sp. N23]
MTRGRPRRYDPRDPDSPPDPGPVPPPWQRGPGSVPGAALPTTPLVRGADLPTLRPQPMPGGLSPDQAPTQLFSGAELRAAAAQDEAAMQTRIVSGTGVRAALRAGAEPGTQAYPWLGDSPTELIPAITDDTELLTRPEAPAPAQPKGRSLGRSTGMMAIASLVSRVTGFLRQIVLVAVLSLGIVNSSYTVANTLPNIVYELLLGGVLSSVMIPLLVRAQRDDPDGGATYTRKLLTVAGVALLLATIVAMLAAGLLTRLYLGGETTATANPDLATAFAWLLLPQIFFYGIGALFGAVLNSKGVFGPFAWAPVLNNVVVLVVLGVFVLVPGEISVNPVEMGNTKLLVLGIGTTLGIAVQALILLPALRRVGVSFKPLFGWDPRLRSAGGLAIWVVGYVLIGQAGYIVTTRVAAAADGGAVAIYSNAWLLLQVPYGVLGVSLLTALMPRMSKAAAEGRIDDVVIDLSLGSRLSTVFLVPISALLTVFGTEVGVALFSLGHGDRDGGASTLGAALAVSAFGLLPYAVTLLQLRVFYALTDSRTPTMIQLVIVVVKIPMLLLCPVLLPPQDVVLGLAAANSLSFVVGAIVGQWLLARRLGHIATGEVLRTVGTTTLSSVVGAIVAYGVVLGIGHLLGGWGAGAGSAWAQLVLALVVAAPVMLAMLWVFRQRELEPVWRRLGGSRSRSRA